MSVKRSKSLGMKRAKSKHAKMLDDEDESDEDGKEYVSVIKRILDHKLENGSTIYE